jgi:hypothetical protein
LISKKSSSPTKFLFIWPSSYRGHLLQINQ